MSLIKNMVTATEHRISMDLWRDEKLDSRHLNLLKLKCFPLNYTTKIQYIHVAAGHRELWKLPPTNRPSIDIRGCQLTTRRFSQGKIPRFARTTQSNPISWKMERKKTSIFEAIVSSTWKIKLKSTLQKAIFRLYSSWGACTKGNMLLRNMQVASSPRIIRKMLFL